jgi:hypothetical protein
VAVTVARPATSAIPNAGIARIDIGTHPWMTGRAAVAFELAGNAASPVPVSIALGDRPVRQALANPGAPVAVTLPVASPGWTSLAVELAPDELRADDRAEVAVRIAPPARVTWDPADRFVAAAAEVLLEGGRILRGDEVVLGSLGRGPSAVLPPDDPARLGALNRALTTRGIPWRFGPRLAQPAVTDSGPLLGPTRLRVRHALQPVGSGETGVLIRVGRDPWMVRAGTAVIIGSRLDTAWTELPVSAAFVPFLDALVNRLVRGELATLTGAPGDAIALPDVVDAVVRGDRRWPVEGGAAFRPVLPGIHFLLAGSDTVGALSVNPDPRESDLTRASPRRVQALWSGARVVDLDQAGSAAFRAAGRGDLRPPLLWLGLLLLVAEAGLAGWRRASPH